MKSFKPTRRFDARETRETHESKKGRGQQQEWSLPGRWDIPFSIRFRVISRVSRARIP
jgi:hypothetical protein